MSDEKKPKLQLESLHERHIRLVNVRIIRSQRKNPKFVDIELDE